MRRTASITTFLIVLGSLVAPTLAWAQQATTARPANPADAMAQDYVEATVNDKIITRGQVRKLLDPLALSMWQEINDQYSNETEGRAEFRRRLESLEREIVHSMVDRLLVIEEFYNRGYAIPPAYLELVFENSITSRFKGDHEAYLRYLQSQGLTEREYRKQLSESIIFDHMRSELRKSVTSISPDRIKTYYEKNREKFLEDEAVKLRQITLKPAGDQTEDLLLQQAKYIVQQARAPNADFAELARKYSDDEFARNGGQAGWYARRQLAEPLEAVAFKLDPGQVSDPVALNGHVFIFKLEEKRAAGIQPLDAAVRSQIENLLAIKDTQEAEQKWLARLRKNAYIHYNVVGLD